MDRNDGDWQRTSKTKPCPICGKADWCGIAADSSAAICMRVQSDRPTRNGGWLHKLHSLDGRPAVRSQSRVIKVRGKHGSGHVFDALAQQYEHALEHESLRALAERLGLPECNLRRLYIGWAAKYGAYSFPMRDADGHATGIRLRFLNGKKLSVKGGHEGLFIPTGLENGGQLIICEGPTDTAAMLNLGFSSAGRPSCTGGTHLLIALVRRMKPLRVVVLADQDEPGLRGAESLVGKLVLHGSDVRIIQPPRHVKDGRDWVRAGATAGDVQRVIDKADSWNLEIHAREVK